MRVLVVGGAGFVGSNLVKLLLKTYDDIQVTVVDNLLSAEITNVPADNRVQVLVGSIADDNILRHVNDDLDYIFHLATFHGNQSSIHDPLMDHANNTLTTLKLLDRVKSFKNLKKLVYSSAGCSVAEKTFDEPTATVEKEITSIKHDSPYSISKIVGEFYSVFYFNQHKVPVVRARFQNVYGPGEILGAGSWRGTTATVWRNVTPTFIYRAIKGLPIKLDNGGDASRDFIFVEDICKGLLACALKGEAGDVYNIASGRDTKILELSQKIIALTNSTSQLELKPKRPWDTSGKRFGSTEKSKEKLGFEATVGIDEGLKTTIEWTLANLPMIEKTMQKHSYFMDSYL
jgi:nucleoside-diphosphate-sugar epimerase